MKIPRHLPFELVDIIADYHDYNKYYKPAHNVIYRDVMSDIISMGEIMPEMMPRIAKECWGNEQAWLAWATEEELDIED
mgnify:FL=1